MRFAFRHVLLLAVITALLMPVMEGTASSHGMEGLSEAGCTCHGENPGEGVEVVIEGLPTTYTAGQSYELEVSLRGGPAAATQGHQGGFNLKASSGTLTPLDASTHVIKSGEITHEHSGANQRSWTVVWEAPLDDKTVEFTVAGNVVDGDHEPTDGDDWALASYTASGEPLTFGERVMLHLPKIIAGLLFAVPLLYLWNTNRR